MSSDFQLRPPVAWRWLLRLVSLVVRRDGRASWFARREANLHSLRILAERGELAGDSFKHLAWLCRDAFASAFLIRCGGFNPRRWMRGPAFLIAAAAAAVLLIAAGTHGFAETRSLLDALGDTGNPAKQDKLMANLFPIAFALATSLTVAVGRISLRGHSWRYLTFFLLKMLSLVTIALLLWVEGGRALRSCIPNETLRVLAGGLVLSMVFIGTLCWAVLWSLADQQHRCCVCLRRLVMPVRIGSWASVFEPATIEWLCEDGHGALCEREIETGAPGQWIGLERVAVSTSSEAL